MPFTLQTLRSKKKVFTNTYSNADLPTLTTTVNNRLVEIFNDVDYDTHEVRYWSDGGTFYASIVYYQLFTETAAP